MIQWSQENNMVLNNSKFEFINHKSASNINSKLFDVLPFPNVYKSYYASELFQISQSSFVRDLGVLVDEKLEWKIHIDKLVKSARQLCYWVLSVFYTRQPVPMLTIFNSIIRSKLEYCSLIWNPYQIQDINKIEQIQRTFTSKIYGVGEMNYWERLSFLGIMSLQRRRERMIIIHIWKILHCQCPNSIDLDFKVHSRTSSIKAVIKPLPKLGGKLLTLYDESFTIKSAKLWNVLPPNLTQITSLPLFITLLDKFLSEIPDKPPIAGYSHLSNNSLTTLCV